MLKIYNSYTREKEEFKAINPQYIGMYVCGPTVYNEVHLGNCRTFISFDIIYRYLLYLGYKVRYVRNITDVGHLVDDVDTDGEDKIAQKARLEKLEPMEIVQLYTNSFHEILGLFNTLSPSIEPTATGHIVEQIDMVADILKNGYGYEKEGSVYFDTMKLVETKGNYGKLSGKVIEELLAESRENLKNQDEKRHPSDFAIWVKADDRHIMRWNSPWSVGFPGWHLECSAMSTKYLGKTFDIHGGGMDLKFPHHENEIAQNYGACDCAPANYWLHANMLTLNGKKMSKRDGNNIMARELFAGTSPLMSKPYSPMVMRFFILQTHYRSTLDLTDAALNAAEKGYQRLMEAFRTLNALAYPENTQAAAMGEEETLINELLDMAKNDMNDDFNTPLALSRLFEIVPKINSFKSDLIPITHISATTFDRLKNEFRLFIEDIFGLKDDTANDNKESLTNQLVEFIIELRKKARQNKDFATSDQIRDTLLQIGVQLKDGKDGTKYSFI